MLSLSRFPVRETRRRGMCHLLTSLLTEKAVLAKLTSKNQLSLPEAVVTAIAHCSRRPA
jgi:hypothetical protein